MVLVKKIFSGLSGFLLILLVVYVVVYVLSSVKMNKKYEVADKSVKISTQKEEIAEGKRLFITRGCIDCHGTDLGGKKFIDVWAIGRFTGTNLTSGKGGIGTTHKTADFERAIRHGVGLDGRALLFMPSPDYTSMSDEDLSRLISYIFSAPSVNTESIEQKVGPMGRFLFVIGKMPMLVSAELIDNSAKAPEHVESKVNLEYGKYIAATCSGCHGDGFSGGPIPGAPPEWPPAQNITPSGRMAKWTEEQFIDSIRKGKRPDGTEIKYPMPWKNFSLMTDTELGALFLYLKSVPPRPEGTY